MSNFDTLKSEIESIQMNHELWLLAICSLHAPVQEGRSADGVEIEPNHAKRVARCEVVGWEPSWIAQIKRPHCLALSVSEPAVERDSDALIRAVERQNLVLQP